MKSALSLFFITLMFGYYHSSLSAAPVTYSIGVHFPEDLAVDAHDLPAYYKGHKINLHRWTSLPAGQPCSILITPAISFKTQGNTIHYLKRDSDEPFLWYDLTLTFSEEEDDAGNKKSFYDWSIQERDEATLPLRIPEHTLVVLANPDHIEGLFVEPAAANSVDVVLPTLYFKNEVSADELCDSLLRAVMEAMDMDAIHCKTCPSHVNCKECVVISSVKQNYEPRG